MKHEYPEKKEAETTANSEDLWEESRKQLRKVEKPKKNKKNCQWSLKRHVLKPGSQNEA